MLTKIILLCVFVYVAFVVRKSRKKMLEEAKKKKLEESKRPIERPVYWCPRLNKPIGREQEYKEITSQSKAKNVEYIHGNIPVSLDVDMPYFNESIMSKTTIVQEI
jgi:hypothetical protein